MITKLNLRNECQDKFIKHLQKHIYIGNLDESKEGDKMLDAYIDITVRIKNEAALQKLRAECAVILEDVLRRREARGVK